MSDEQVFYRVVRYRKGVREYNTEAGWNVSPAWAYGFKSRSTAVAVARNEPGARLVRVTVRRKPRAFLSLGKDGLKLEVGP